MTLLLVRSMRLAKAMAATTTIPVRATSRTRLHSFWSSSSSSSSWSSVLLPLQTKELTIQRVVPNTSASQLLTIVQDVDRYSDFVPFCTHSQIVSHPPPTTTNDHSSSSHVFYADLTIGFAPPFGVQTYTSRVQVWPHLHRIETTRVPTNATHQSPSSWMESLSSTWQLTPVVEPARQPKQSQPSQPFQQPLPSQPSSSSSSSSSSLSSSLQSHSPPPHLQSPPQESCQVHFSMTLQTRDPVLYHALDHVLPQVAEAQVQAFVQRCHQQPQRQEQQEQQRP